MARALVVEDELDVARLVVFHLRAAGFEVHHVARGEDAIATAIAVEPDIILLDIGLPGVDGFEVARRLRAEPRTRRIGIIMVSARDSSDDRLAGLEAGIDTLVAKPFVVRELVLRAEALARRVAAAAAAAAHDGVLVAGSVTLDRVQREVTVHGRRVALRPLEYRVLELLMANPTQVFTRARLVEEAWGLREAVSERTVDVVVSRLRDHLGDAADLVETVLGAGYRLRRRG